MSHYKRSMYQTEMNKVDDMIKKVQFPVHIDPPVQWTRKELRESFYTEKGDSFIYQGAQRSRHTRCQTSFKFERYGSSEKFIKDAQKVLNMNKYVPYDGETSIPKRRVSIAVEAVDPIAIEAP